MLPELQSAILFGQCKFLVSTVIFDSQPTYSFVNFLVIGDVITSSLSFPVAWRYFGLPPNRLKTTLTSGLEIKDFEKLSDSNNC